MSDGNLSTIVLTAKFDIYTKSNFKPSLLQLIELVEHDISTLRPTSVHSHSFLIFRSQTNKNR